MAKQKCDKRQREEGKALTFNYHKEDQHDKQRARRRRFHVLGLLFALFLGWIADLLLPLLLLLLLRLLLLLLPSESECTNVTVVLSPAFCTRSLATSRCTLLWLTLTTKLLTRVAGSKFSSAQLDCWKVFSHWENLFRIFLAYFSLSSRFAHPSQYFLREFLNSLQFVFNLRKHLPAEFLNSLALVYVICFYFRIFGCCGLFALLLFIFFLWGCWLLQI